jgi:2-keto-4-pentenoate hydratase/2-oxohepta-3-ene-1,7-dioic acid hydratase in catechol pathway
VVKFALAMHRGGRTAGVVDDEAGTWRPLAEGYDLGERGLAELLDGRLRQPDLTGERLALTAVELLAPIPRPARNIICVGKNYADHAQEFQQSGYDASASGDPVPEVPIFFTKTPSTVVGPGAQVCAHVGLTSQVDYEAEVAVVIGRGGKDIARNEAMSHVAFFTLANDVTARDLQHRHRQWFFGKSLDTFCPLGPWLVSADELAVEDVSLCCWVNDELRQQAKLSELIFDIPMLISTLSRGMTLQAGDVLLTGTPAGVGIGYDPPRFLRPGDTVRIEGTGLGRLTNMIRA